MTSEYSVPQRKGIILSTGLYVKENDFKAPFKNSTQGDDYNFECWDDLSQKNPQAVEISRK